VKELVTERRFFYIVGFLIVKQLPLFLNSLLWIHINGMNVNYSAPSGYLSSKLRLFYFRESYPYHALGRRLVRIPKAGLNMLA
jgi:hypothetical protein